MGSARIRSSGCRITNYGNYAMIQKPILFSFSFRLLWVSVVVLVVIEALLWTRSQNPFWPETGLQAFRQLKALTWTRGSASQLVTKLQSGTQSPTAPNLPPTQVFCGKFFPRFACHLRGWCPDYDGGTSASSFDWRKHGNFFAP